MGMFNFEIPEKLHQDFKIKSIKKGKDMKDILVEIIQEFVNKK